MWKVDLFIVCQVYELQRVSGGEEFRVPGNYESRVYEDSGKAQNIAMVAKNVQVLNNRRDYIADPFLDEVKLQGLKWIDLRLLIGVMYSDPIKQRNIVAECGTTWSWQLVTPQLQLLQSISSCQMINWQSKSSHLRSTMVYRAPNMEVSSQSQWVGGYGLRKDDGLPNILTSHSLDSVFSIDQLSLFCLFE
jgi:hypothetical protein